MTFLHAAASGHTHHGEALAAALSEKKLTAAAAAGDSLPGLLRQHGDSVVNHVDAIAPEWHGIRSAFDDLLCSLAILLADVIHTVHSNQLFARGTGAVREAEDRPADAEGGRGSVVTEELAPLLVVEVRRLLPVGIYGKITCLRRREDCNHLRALTQLCLVNVVHAVVIHSPEGNFTRVNRARQ